MVREANHNMVSAVPVRDEGEWAHGPRRRAPGPARRTGGDRVRERRWAVPVRTNRPTSGGTSGGASGANASGPVVGA